MMSPRLYLKYVLHSDVNRGRCGCMQRNICCRVVWEGHIAYIKKTSRILTNKSAHVASKYGHVLESYKCVPLQECFNITVTILMLSDLEAADSVV